MNNPYLIRLLGLLVALFIPTLVAMAVIDSGLKTMTTPMGIVSFEFCGIASSCEQALSQWGMKGQQLAMLSLGIDYLFMVLYPSMICIALLLIAAKLPLKFHKVTRWIAWITLLSGVFDAFENKVRSLRQRFVALTRPTY